MNNRFASRTPKIMKNASVNNGHARRVNSCFLTKSGIGLPLVYHIVLRDLYEVVFAMCRAIPFLYWAAVEVFLYLEWVCQMNFLRGGCNPFQVAPVLFGRVACGEDLACKHCVKCWCIWYLIIKRCWNRHPGENILAQTVPAKHVLVADGIGQQFQWHCLLKPQWMGSGIKGHYSCGDHCEVPLILSQNRSGCTINAELVEIVTPLNTSCKMSFNPDRIYIVILIILALR